MLRDRFRSGAAALALVSFVAGAACADPAYTSKSLLEAFLKDKAVAEAAKAHPTRSVCFQGDDDPACARPASHDLLLNFEFDSDRLTPSAIENLSQVAATLKDPQLRGVKFKIEGYTDATGTDDYNLSLSERRARSVVNYLVSSGVSRETLEPRGFGKSKPRVADPFSAENRRVETHLSVE